MNHKGVKMDTEPEQAGPADVGEVIPLVEKIRRRGMGVISMKLAGEGTFISREDRQAAMRTAFGRAGVDCVTLGYKNEAEIDEAIENLNRVLG